MFTIDTNTFQSKERLAFLNRNGVDIWQETIACPVQIYGDVEGYALYYRSRSNHWYVEIGEDFVFTGTDTYYGWTPPHVAMAQIWQAVKAWQLASKAK